jgi:hypothetical protein
MDDAPLVAFIGLILVLVCGCGWLISRDQDADQARALACITAGSQFVSGDCVAGPTP